MNIDIMLSALLVYQKELQKQLESSLALNSERVTDAIYKEMDEARVVEEQLKKVKKKKGSLF